MSYRPGYDHLPRDNWVDPTPPPAHIQDVPNVGATSAILTSAAFALGAHCGEYNEDFMLCKRDSANPAHCLKEGARVTRCSIDLLTQLRANCLKELSSHWNCLELNNHEFQYCRKQERPLNQCIFSKFGYTKTIPGAAKNATPVHELKKPYFGNTPNTF
ncbi:ndufa8, NADH-ubiquinone oxidoreductase complex I 19kd subunit [Dimargaris cristalligena]|uniref:NADH-ubiquinone oxidoreductase n=1 Tax=Dimargaris cristalligena TaxID=215637 RepID=A0A4P9ZPL5_9FUNG|nr:ndufa8, NADH-ubiquinone oxidoreductase complex I 19kd subunit [Dimargaris cristalligena]RKP35376.1 NADH dehydrogenase 1 alpha subcomplex 8 [Dimargaris cristalligena]|eukprot:RKP35376.1 NADH dehydrogenase 1 alpha subcomplex 8 [Dimargaris cristalligena]